MDTKQVSPPTGQDERGTADTSRSFTLGILEAGDNRADLIAEHGTYSDWFEDLLSTGTEMQIAYRRYPVHAGTLPGSAHECDGYLLTGSRASVTEGADWMAATQGFIKQVADDRPVIGVCFGHQLIADAFGGRAEASPTGWVVGVHDYDIGQTKPWMAPRRERISLVSSNCDQVTVPPPAAEVLGGNPTCPIGMMQIGGNILTIQTHPEVPKPLIEIIYRARAEQIGAEKTDQAITSLARSTDGEVLAQWFHRFLLK